MTVTVDDKPNISIFVRLLHSDGTKELVSMSKSVDVIITSVDYNMSAHCRKCSGSYPFHRDGCPESNIKGV